MNKVFRLSQLWTPLLAGFLFVNTALAAEEIPLSFGVGPYQSPTKMAQQWLPVLKYLTETSGIPLQFRTAKDTTAFETRLREGAFDITFMSPFLYIELHKTVGYEPLVRGQLKTEGIIVVKTESPFQSLKDLQNLEVAFPSAAAFGPSMLPRAFMKKEGVVTTPRYVGSHESVYQAVTNGIYPAGGGAKHTLGALDPTSRAKLRVLWSSQEFTPPPIAAHPRVPDAVRATLTQALLHMHEDASGLRLLMQIGFAPGFAAALDSDWNDVRSLNLGSLKATTEQ